MNGECLQNAENEVLSWQIVNECNLTNKQSMLLYSVLMRCGFKLVNDLSKGLVLLPDDDGDAKLIELQSLVRTSKKRKRKEISADDDVQPVLKRQKLNAIKTMFADSNTHKQCLAIYGGIFSSDLSKTLPVPLMLIKEIAEYSTGKLKQCMGANKHAKRRLLHWIATRKNLESMERVKSLGIISTAMIIFAAMNASDAQSVGSISIKKAKSMTIKAGMKTFGAIVFYTVALVIV